MEVKLAITAELQSLKQELGEKGHPSPQDEELLSALKEQVRYSALYTHNQWTRTLSSMDLIKMPNVFFSLACFF